ncbi:MAG: hypothetical protein ACTSRP_23045 [Candidatus Helarchaeota archaeon]
MVVDLGYRVWETKELLSYYEQIMNYEVNIDRKSVDEKNRLEELSRRIYLAKKNKMLNEYDIEEIVAKLNIDVLETWKAVNYLKQKVIYDLAVTTPVIAQVEKGGSEGFSIQLRDENIKIEDHVYDIKALSKVIEVKREYDLVGGLIRFKVVVRNNGAVNINNIDVQLRMPEHLRLIKIVPEVYAKKERATIPNMSPKQSQSIDFYIEPLICGSIPVETLVVYQDIMGKFHSIIRESKQVITKCPPIINPGEENIARVKNLLKEVLKSKQSKSFRIKGDVRRVFQLMQESVQSWAGNCVSRPIIHEGPPFKAEAYYYNLNKVIQTERIILKIECLEDKELGMITVGSDKLETATGVLTHIWELCQKRLSEAFGIKLKSLWCPQCSAPLINAPRPGEKIKCHACGTIMTPEALTG